MPVQECQLDGKPGYQWGESGKCYTYASGNENARKEAKRKAYIQGYAIGELTEMEIHEWIPVETELANFLDVPVLRAGIFPSHNAGPIEITEDDLDEIVEGSNELQPLIQRSIETGVYDGNEKITARLSKPIPGLLNLKHQSILPETIKQISQGITTSFRKVRMKDGNNWIVQRFQHVPNDLADTIQREYPYRSVELLPLSNPLTGKQYKKIIRSTAFLDKFTPPAVSGQTPEFLVEFQGTEEDPITITITITTGVQHMAEKKHEEKSVDVSELQKMQETLTEQTTALAELQAKFAKSEKERKQALELAKTKEAEKEEVTQEVLELRAIRDEVKELRAQNEVLDSDKLINHLKRFRHLKEEKQSFRVSPAYLEIVEPIIRKNGVIELAEGQNYRQAMTHIFDEIAELASKHAVLVPLGTQGEKLHTREDEKPKDFDAEVHELMEAEQIELGEAIERVTAKHRNVQKEA